MGMNMGMNMGMSMGMSNRGGGSIPTVLLNLLRALQHVG